MQKKNLPRPAVICEPSSAAGIKRWLLLFLALALWTPVGPSLRAQVVGMQDTFVYTTSNINGHAPLFGPGTWSGSYIGTANISTNGTEALLTTDGGTPGGGGQAIANYAFTPAANTIYTIQATWKFTGPLNSAADCWVATGFTNSVYGGNQSGNHGPWMLIRPQASAGASPGTAGFVGTTNVGSTTVPSADYSAPITTMVSWNTMTGQVLYYLNGVLQSTWTSTTTAPSGSYNAYFHSASTGNFVDCTSVTLAAQQVTAVQMQDNFTYTTANINGHSATSSPAGWGTWSLWQSSGMISTDGQKAIIQTNGGTPGAGGAIGSFPFTPMPGQIYMVTATLNFTGPVGSGIDCWAGIGFSGASNSLPPWMFIRPQATVGTNGTVTAESNGNTWTNSYATVPASYYSGPVTATVIWNTGTGISQYYVNNLLVLTTPAGSAYIPSGPCNIFFRSFQTGNAFTVSNMTLSEQGATPPLICLSSPNDVADFSALINTPSPNTTWPTAQSKLNVFQLNDGLVEPALWPGTKNLVQQTFTYCHANNIKVSLSGYGLLATPTCGHEEGYTSTAEQNVDVTDLNSLGVAPDYLHLDEPLSFGVYAPTGGVGGGCGLSVATAASQTAASIVLYLTAFPNIKVIDTETSSTARLHAADIQTFLTDVATDVQAQTGKPFAFAALHIDITWGYDPYTTYAPLLPILAAKGTAFGIIFNGLAEDHNVPEVWTTNVTENMLASEEGIQEFNASGLPSLGIIDFASWNLVENGTIGEYSTATGAATNASLVTGLYGPTALTLSGSDLFVTRSKDFSIGEYTTAGATVNASLFPTGNPHPTGTAVVGSDLFIANDWYGKISEYTTSGTVVNAALITGLNYPMGIVASGSNLFVVNSNSGTIGEYTTAGATVNASLVTGLNQPCGIAISGSNLFVANAGNGTIGEYTTSGTTVNAALVTGLHMPTDQPVGIAVSGSDIFVINGTPEPGGGTISEYTTSGATVNAALITGLNQPTGLAVSGSNLFVVNNNSGGNLPNALLPETTFGTYTNLLNFFFDSPLALEPPPEVLELMSNTSNRYYLSTSFTEMATLVSGGWTDKGPQGGIEPNPSCAPNLVPLYEYANPSGDYAYSRTYGASMPTSYSYSKVKGYVFPDASEGGTPFYQFYDATDNLYYYSVNATNPGAPAGGTGTYGSPTVVGYVTPRWMPAPNAVPGPNN